MTVDDLLQKLTNATQPYLRSPARGALFLLVFADPAGHGADIRRRVDESALSSEPVARTEGRKLRELIQLVDLVEGAGRSQPDQEAVAERLQRLTWYGYSGTFALDPDAVGYYSDSNDDLSTQQTQLGWAAWELLDWLERQKAASQAEAHAASEPE
jgi:hypothetical protein